MLGLQVNFYEKLFKSEGRDREAGVKLLENLEITLNKEDKNILERKVSKT